jgi:tripartite-type tricarboxylate transporter receptor subunit TctC
MTWRGIMVPKKTPQNVVDVLRAAAKKTTDDPAFKEVLTKMNLTSAYLDAPEFKVFVEKDNEFYKALMTKLGMAK